MKIIKSFKSKSGKNIQIVEPSMDLLDELLIFANKLAKEDTFLTFDPGKEIEREGEGKWLESQIINMQKDKNRLYWAICNNRIIGAVDIHRGFSVRDYHIGNIGLMIAEDFRADGIGKILFNLILEKAKEMGLRTATLAVFSDNDIAIALYKKNGFVEYGNLPDGLWRQKHFSDHIYMYKKLLD